MKYNYIVYGAGRQGTAAIYDLAKNCEAQHINVIDPSQDAIVASFKKLSPLLGDEWLGDGGRIFYDKSIQDNHLGGFHAALCCAPYSATFDIMKKITAAKVPFCDLGGNPEVVAQQKQYTENRAGFVSDCGISPGLSNIIAAHLIKSHGVDQLIVRCGGIPNKPSKKNPFHYKLTFDPQGLISEYSGQVPFIMDGQLTFVEALSIVDHFGEFEGSPTSNNSPGVVEWFLEQGIKDYEYRTLRWPGHWVEVKKQWKGQGYLCGDAEKDTELLELLKTDKKLQYNSETDKDRLILSVVGYKSGDIREQWGYSFDLHADPETKFSAMEMSTSWGITLVAHTLAKRNEGFAGVGFTGFMTPEQFMDGGWVINQLRKRMENRA